jgi:Leucine-rich repeat (LRR) protein
MDGNDWSPTDIGMFSTMTSLTSLSISAGLSGNLTALSNLVALTHLELKSNHLSGSLSELPALHLLQHLHLNSNRLSGTIPSELAQLTALTDLNLGHNQLTGAIPSQLAELKGLHKLYLLSNPLTGTIPLQLTKLTELKQLAICGCRLSGTIPSQLAKLTELSALWLGDNRLNGTIPSQLAKLTGLGWLHIDNQPVTGTIPSELGMLTKLTYLELSGNLLTGTIPSQLGELTELTYLDLGVNAGNRLNGTIPSQLAKLTRLTSLLRLSHNELTGTIPSQLAKLTGLKILGLDHNHLNGTIPPQLGQITSLASVDLSSNTLSGTIPSTITKLKRCATLNLGGNQLTGPVPSTIGELTGLTYLHLGINRLTGTVPQEMTQLKNLTYLAIESNHRLTGKLPAFEFSQFKSCCDMIGDVFTCPLPEGADMCIGGPGCGGGKYPPACFPACNGSSSSLTASDCSAWQRFSRDPLYEKWAEGKCGTQVHTDPCSCTFTAPVGCTDWRITSIDMDSQHTPMEVLPSGVVPLALLDLTDLTVLILGRNQLDGTIPSAIGQLTGLTSLSLGGNQLDGTIPSAIGQLAELTDLSLGTNQLTGSVPTEMMQLKKLTNIRLDTNPDLTGPLPAFNFAQFTECCAMEGDSFKCPLPAGAEKCAGGPGPGCGNRSIPKCIVQLPCTGSSANLTPNDCSAWQQSFDSMEGKGWKACSDSRLDPCSCGGSTCDPGQDQVCVKCMNGELTGIRLEGNGLEGTIPDSVGQMTSISYLYLAVNQLTGAIPSALTNLKLLSTLNLAHNKLGGLVPPLPFAQYTGECSLSDLTCHEPRCNNFTCPLPANSDKCKVLPATGSAPGVHCSPPKCVGNLSPTDCTSWVEFFDATKGLSWTRCSSNRLDPCSCGDSSCVLGGGGECVKCTGGEITAIQLIGNGLAGSIPPSLGQLAELSLLRLDNNKLVGTIPSSIGQLATMGFLALGSNQLTGTIPAQLGQLTAMRELWLNRNKLTGLVPELPFNQLMPCYLDERATGGCTKPFCNNFRCPLPANAAHCGLAGGKSYSPYFKGTPTDATRNDWDGEVGFTITPTGLLNVTALGRATTGAGLNASTNVTVWDATTKQAVVSVEVGPRNSALESGYAYVSLASPITLRPGKTYSISQTCHKGMPDIWVGAISQTNAKEADGTFAKLGPGVYSAAAGTFPDATQQPAGRFAGIVTFKSRLVIKGVQCS